MGVYRVAAILLVSASHVWAAPLAPPDGKPHDIPWTPIPVQTCCKTCSKGKACGDSCISRDKNCHKGQGCACDG